MRLLSITLLVIAFPLATQAQTPKQVEVINLPAVQEVSGSVEVTNDATNPVEVVGEVEVTNLPAANAPARFQLVGFTSATYTGAMGGPFGVTEKCQLEFPNSRMCSLEEVVLTTTIPSGLTGTAWVHRPANSLPPVQASVDTWPGGGNCFAYASQDSVYGGIAVDITGNLLEPFPVCTDQHRIACCSLVP